MATATIGEKDIARLAPQSRENGSLVPAFLWDGELKGFGIKATPGGKKVFVVQYRIGGRAGTTQRLTLGVHGRITLTQARQLAKAALGRIANRADPAEEKRQAKREKREKRAAGTLRDAIHSYLASHETPRSNPSKYWRDRRANLLGGSVKGSEIGSLLDLPIGDVKRVQIKDAMDAVKVRSPAVARVLFADLRPVFRYALERELIAINPMAGIKGPKPVAARDRVLEEPEVKAFWQATKMLSWPFATIYMLLILTGCRREEVAGMAWRELDLDHAVWEIPGSRTKNKRPHRVPLAPAGVAMLNRAAVLEAKALGRYPWDSELVFSTTGTTAPSGFSKAKAALDRHMQAILGSKFKSWRVHDLRRTCATGMEDLGVPTAIVETALNHISGAKAGIVGVYQRAEHREAVKNAFARWEQRLLEIVGGGDGGSNVVPLRKAG